MRAALFLLLFVTAAANAEKTLVYCAVASPSSLNPQLVDDGPSFNVTMQIYNGLLGIIPGTTQIGPALAEKWSVSKDGLTYTFHLRKNVQFHTTPTFKPTRPLNSDDVLFSFQRALDKTHPFHMVGGGTYPYFSNMELPSLIKSVTKVDDQTVKFTLSKPDAPFLDRIAAPFAVILSAEYGDQLLKAKTPEKIDLDPVGTGPFVFKRYDKDTEVRFVNNPNYWGSRAKLDKLVFLITPDASVRMQKMKTGECQVASGLSMQSIEALNGDDKIKILSVAGLNVGYLSFNVEKPPFNKVEVRQAINHALNRANYLKAVYRGSADLARGTIPPMVWGANPQAQYDYNPEKARELLKKAGYPNGFETEMWTLPVARPYMPDGKKLGELMQADLAQVGIKVKLVTYDWVTYLDKSRNGDHQMIQMGAVGDSGDPDGFTGALWSCAAVRGGWNVSRWCNGDYDKLVSQALATTDIKARTKLYHKMEEIFQKDAPWVPLAHGKEFRALAKNVVGYKMDPLGSDEFSSVDLK